MARKPPEPTQAHGVRYPGRHSPPVVRNRTGASSRSPRPRLRLLRGPSVAADPPEPVGVSRSDPPEDGSRLPSGRPGSGGGGALRGRLSEIVSSAGITLPQVHHGYDGSCWAVNQRALPLGHGIRTGIEDVTVLPDGRAAKSNAELVEAARSLIESNVRHT